MSIQIETEPLEFPGIMTYLNDKTKNIDDDEFTKYEIRAIFIGIHYNRSKLKDIADYYEIPINVVRGIAARKLFSSVTKNIG